MSLDVGGFASRGFEGVAETFQDSLDQTGETGAALSVRVDGTTVVDLWAGTQDAVQHTPWGLDTATVIFSCTKGLLAILVAELVERTGLDLDQPVAKVWPEFAAAGKESVPIRWLLAHRAGLPATREDLSLSDILDWSRVVDRLAHEAPLWEPGSGYSYHALTYGWLVGEVVRRVSGMTVGEYFKSTIAAPLGVDAWIGVPEHELHRVARLYEGKSLTAGPATALSSDTALWVERAMTLGGALPAKLVSPNGGFNREDVRKAQIPGAGGVATARALATIWSATVVETDGVRLVHDDVLAQMTTVQSEGSPVYKDIPGPYPRWGTGFMLDSPPVREFLSPSSFGHDGAGGQVAFADPIDRVGFGYVTNLLEGAGDLRGQSLVRALRDALK